MNSLTYWRGGSALDDMRRDFDLMMNRFFGSEIGNGQNVEKGSFLWSPRVDVSETEKAMVVKADLPGVDPKDLEITMHNGSLVIRGEKKEEKKESKENFHRVERFSGTFYRSIELPETADASNITAQTSKGVVTITIPRKPEAQPKKITVKPID